MFERIKALIHRWDEIREVDAMSDRDLDDIGLSRAQLEEFVRMPHDLDKRVTAMAAIFGVDETALRQDHGHLIDMLHTCGHCEHRGACALVLERGELSRPRDAGFCPNAADFTQIAAKAAA
ncbi:DUF1127 domain-containing protein [Fuscibacter oryzae]|uniref:DUF1127 domain-containing protein n=1 Tax=Fuscibacter oryzae TaxID=2803939 RepID=A0A8J7SWM8_9RHOB|nr:DUF1127 domain-containing protein [Fuscibacter oryzae]MBL4929836.1 DUF1127 domain-containing protein [Fuscibacter oryzae]